MLSSPTAPSVAPNHVSASRQAASISLGSRSRAAARNDDTDPAPSIAAFSVLHLELGVDRGHPLHQPQRPQQHAERLLAPQAVGDRLGRPRRGRRVEQRALRLASAPRSAIHARASARSPGAPSRPGARRSGSSPLGHDHLDRRATHQRVEHERAVGRLARRGALGHISLRPSRAWDNVTSSAYSRSPPTGRPLASRVTRTPSGLISAATYIAVALPSRLGLVARMHSVT